MRWFSCKKKKRNDVTGKKIWGMTIAIIVLFALGVYAGGQKAPAEGPAEKQILIYNSNWSDAKYRIADETVVEMFQAENPNVKVIHSIIADEDFKAAIRAYLQASPPPDVLTWYAGNSAKAIAARMIRGRRRLSRGALGGSSPS